MESCSAIQRNEVATQATRYRGLENSCSCERSQAQRDKYCLTPILGKAKNRQIQSIVKQTGGCQGWERRHRAQLLNRSGLSSEGEGDILELDRGGWLHSTVNVLDDTEPLTLPNNHKIKGWLLLCTFHLNEYNSKNNNTTTLRLPMRIKWDGMCKMLSTRPGTESTLNKCWPLSLLPPPFRERQWNVWQSNTMRDELDAQRTLFLAPNKKGVI